jgi:hypothetical protein
MKTIRTVLIPILMAMFASPLIHAQDLSRYRKFSLGTSFADLSKQVGPYSHETTLIHQRPALIQELMCWPLNRSSSVRVDPVSQIVFNFYNAELYKIVVTYERDAVEGLTDEDMVQAVSAQYGIGTRLYPEINFPTNDVFVRTEQIIAHWGDSQNSVNLLGPNGGNSFELVIFSKELDAKAAVAIADSVKLEKEEAPQKEIDRNKKEADSLELARQINQKTFRP